MKRVFILGFLILLQLLYIKLVQGQPDFTNAIESHGVILFGDITERNTYYYMPGDLVIGTTHGRPDFSLILMRYNGTAVYGEEESMRYRNILSMRITMKAIPDDSLRLAGKQLGRNHIQLKPLPLTMIEAMVVFTPVGEPDTSIVKRGDLAADADAGNATMAALWTERHFTIHLDNHSAALLQEALKKDRTALSFMYAFHAKGSTTLRLPSFSGDARLSKVMRQQLGQNDPDTSRSVKDCIVKSNAFAVYLDPLDYDKHIRKIDINNSVPPGYAMLNVRNYDFANNLREDLYEKTVELEAVGAGGRKVQASVKFSLHAPDVSSIHFRFKYAVRLDQPYRYRTIELLRDGSERVSDWQDVKIWSGLLDVTSRKQ